jgi:hypothetical protein
MVMTRGEAFEQTVRTALAERDRQRRARIMDPANYQAADSAFVAAVMTAAGYEVPDHAAKTVRRGRRAAAENQAAAFGEAG